MKSFLFWCFLWTRFPRSSDACIFHARITFYEVSYLSIQHRYGDVVLLFSFSLNSKAMQWCIELEIASRVIKGDTIWAKLIFMKLQFCSRWPWYRNWLRSDSIIAMVNSTTEKPFNFNHLLSFFAVWRVVKVIAQKTCPTFSFSQLKIFN